MKRTAKTSRGFTLIELMIVIAIIAIIASIAIPSVTSSIKSANERSASASLKALAEAQLMFRQYFKGLYWTRDVRALHRGRQVGSAENVKFLSDQTLAAADEYPTSYGPYDIDGDRVYDFTIDRTVVTNRVAQPKSGYRYGVLSYDENFQVYRSSGIPRCSNGARFGFYARPHRYPSSGRMTFQLTETGVVTQADIHGTPPGGWLRRYQTTWQPVQ